MSIQEFAKKHSLKTEQHEDGELIVPGRSGHLYDFHDGRIGVFSDKAWNRRKVKFEGVGAEIVLDCMGEGLAVIDPSNTAQVEVAIWASGARKKRRLTEEQRQAACERLREYQFQKREAA